MTASPAIPETARRRGGTKIAHPLAAGLLLIGAAYAPAAVDTGAFRLGDGHAARNELCFIVAAPGPIHVTVENDTPDVPIHVSLQPPARVAVVSRQGTGAIDFEYTPTQTDLGRGLEWAVTVVAADGRSTASGRIRVERPDGHPSLAYDLDRWLLAHPAIAWHMAWRDPGDPVARPYFAWDPEVQQRLRRFFADARGGWPNPLPDPPPNLARPADADFPRTVLSRDDALDVYLASVAQSLQVEYNRRYPWSVNDDNAGELDALFSSLSFFHRCADPDGYEIVPSEHGWAIPAPPDAAWRFLAQHQLIRRSRLDSVVALVEWCRGLSHFGGGMTAANFADHWGYRGLMPVARALEGTRYTGSEFRDAFGDAPRHYTAGCHGTVGLLVSTLRAINIPARYRSVNGDRGSHATVIFLSEDRALTHGDDPYNRMAVRARTDELLIDLPTYQRWLGPLADGKDRIGLQALNLGLKYLSPSLFECRRQDLAEGRPKATSRVREAFGQAFTLEDLERARLWERLDNELAITAGPARAFPADPAAGHGDAKNDPAPASSSRATTVIEGESMKPEPTGGRVEMQPMEGFTAARWSGNRQLWWTGAGVKDSLRLAFELPGAGVYRLSAVFTRAPDYGMFALTLDGQGAGPKTVDLYDKDVTRSAPVPLGDFKLAAGPHELAAAVVGRNPDALPGLMFGLDVLICERIE